MQPSLMRPMHSSASSSSTTYDHGIHHHGFPGYRKEDTCHNCARDDNPPAPNGSQAVSLLLRICTLGFALASAVVMVPSSDCTTAVPGGGVTVTVATYTRYSAFVYLVGCNICAAILEAAAIYLQFIATVSALLVAGSTNDDDDDLSHDCVDEEQEAPGVDIPAVLLVVIDVLSQALLYTATGAAYAAAAAYGAQIGGCVHFTGQVERSKALSLCASFAVGIAVAVKDMPLPFSVWPKPKASD